MGLYYGITIPLAIILAVATGFYMAKAKEDVGTGKVMGAMALFLYLILVFLIGFWIAS